MDVHDAVARLRDAGSRSWYLERVARLRGLADRVTEAVASTGHTARVRAATSAPVVTVRFTPIERPWGTVRARYGLAITASALADVYLVEHTVEAPNVFGRDGVDPTLFWSSYAPAIEPLAAASTVLDSLGFRALGARDAHEACPGLTFPPNSMFRGTVDVWSALTIDLNRWMAEPPGDVRPRVDVPPELASLVEAAALVVDADVTAADPPWLVVAEDATRSASSVAAIEALHLPRYPAAGWTVDFGDVTGAGLGARFCTDVFVSRVVPFWYLTDRFTIEHTQPDRLADQLRQWSARELGYTKPQSDLVMSLRERMSAAGATELGEWQLSSSLHLPSVSAVPASVTVKDILFRDPLRRYPRAAAMEEESSHRDLGVRGDGAAMPQVRP